MLPAVFRPDELDKLGWTAVVTLTAPNVLAGLALIAGTRDWKRVSRVMLRMRLREGFAEIRFVLV